jgi:hypothetical protein
MPLCTATIPCASFWVGSLMYAQPPERSEEQSCMGYSLSPEAVKCFENVYDTAHSGHTLFGVR